MNSRIRSVIKFMFLLLATGSIILKEQIVSQWDILFWIPIATGFAFWFDGDAILGEAE